MESSAKASAATLGLNNLPGDFFFFSSTFRVSLQINLRWVDALIQSNCIDAQREDVGKEEEAANAEK